MGRQGKTIAWVLGLGLPLPILALLLSRAAGGGDEATALVGAQLVETSGWRAALAGDWGYLIGHRLYWTLEKIALDNLLALLLPARLYGSEIIHTWLMVADGPLFMLAALLVMVGHLAHRHGLAIASLAAGALFLASPAISFFSGGTMESQMCFFASVLAVLLNGSGKLPLTRFVLLLAAAALLVLSKPYSALFLLPLGLLLSDGTQRRIFMTTSILLAVIWLGVEGAAGSAGAIKVTDNFESLMSVTPGALLVRGISFFVSVPFGIIWSFPLLIFALPAPRRTLALKSLAVLAPVPVFLLFDFWHGAGAVAGPRYSVPYLVIFVPEIAAGMATLRRKSLVLAVPLLTLLFLPSIEYRNSLMAVYENRDNRGNIWPLTDVSLHPGIFPWRVIAAKAAEMENFRPSLALPFVIPARAVFPMTGLSRAIYALQNPQDPRTRPARDWLVRHGFDVLAWLQALRLSLASAVLAWMLAAAAAFKFAAD